jgi:hypothetical protein
MGIRKTELGKIANILEKTYIDQLEWAGGQEIRNKKKKTSSNKQQGVEEKGGNISI